MEKPLTTTTTTKWSGFEATLVYRPLFGLFAPVWKATALRGFRAGLLLRDDFEESPEKQDGQNISTSEAVQGA
jgi:hypothetical protein